MVGCASAQGGLWWLAGEGCGIFGSAAGGLWGRLMTAVARLVVGLLSAGPREWAAALLWASWLEGAHRLVRS